MEAVASPSPLPEYPTLVGRARAAGGDQGGDQTYGLEEDLGEKGLGSPHRQRVQHHTFR